MIHLAHARSARPRSTTAARVILTIGWLACALPVDAARANSATTERTVRWAASPLRDIYGRSLPPAAGYEVWLSADAGPESLVAVAPDTQHTLHLEGGVTYVVRVRAIGADGAKSPFSEPSDPFEAPKDATASPTPEAQPTLGPAWPNPFNARVTLAYQVPDRLPAGSPFGLAIHDLRGRKVAALALDRRPGVHTVDWMAADGQGRRLPSGVYIAHYDCGGQQTSLRLTLVS